MRFGVNQMDVKEVLSIIFGLGSVQGILWWWTHNKAGKAHDRIDTEKDRVNEMIDEKEKLLEYKVSQEGERRNQSRLEIEKDMHTYIDQQAKDNLVMIDRTVEPIKDKIDSIEIMVKEIRDNMNK